MSTHPKDRPGEPDDPLEACAAHAPGDPLLMLDCLVEEFARMGFGEPEVLELFERPEFLATHGLRHHVGAQATRERVRRVLARCGVLRVVSRAAPPEPGRPFLRS